MPRKPWKHQHEAYDRLGRLWQHGAPGVGLFSGMGTGKSLVACALWKAFGFRRVLLVAPKAMVEEWADIIPAELGYDAFPLLGTIKERFDKAMLYRDWPGPYAMIVTPDSYWREPLKTALLDAIPFDLVVVDESQKIKSAGSKTSRFAYTLARGVPYRLAMTGTPLHDKPLDAYGQYRFLDPRIFGTNYGLFEARYAIKAQVAENVSAVVGYQNMTEFAERMYSIAFRVSDDVLDLPPIVEHTRYVRLSPKTRRLYDTLERDLVLTIEDRGTVVAGNVLTKLLRLQELTSGYASLTGEDGAIVETVGSEKEDALVDMLDECDHGKPVVVFARFRYDLRAIQRAAVRSGRMHFEQSGERNEWRDWRASDEPAVIGVQVASGGAGVNLTRAPVGIFYSYDHSLGDYQQAVKRIHRPGQTERTMIYHLLARDSVDVRIRAAIREKREIVESVISTYRQR